MTELHISTTGQLFSLRPEGAALDERSAVWSALRYGEGPDAVLVSYGIQGTDYFRGIVRHFDEIMDGVRCVMGYVWLRHVPIYRRGLRGLATVEELFRGFPYGKDGPEMAWIVCTKETKHDLATGGE